MCKQIEQMMEHLVSLLCETKHRGAFEQAYVGFHQLCTRLWQSTNADLKLLPIRCLHDTLIGITGLIPGYSKLCATRRSAGVPFLIQVLRRMRNKILLYRGRSGKLQSYIFEIYRDWYPRR